MVGLIINLIISMLLVIIAFVSIMMNVPPIFCYFIVFVIFLLVKELPELLKK